MRATSHENCCRRLLVITHLFLPDACGGAPIFTDMCHGLADRGIEVTVRTAYPYYPEWTDKSGRNGVKIERHRDGNLTIERYGLFIPRDPKSLWQRLLYESSFFASIARSLAHGGRFDAVIVFCPLAGSVAFAGLHKLFHRAPLLLNVQDLPADAAAAGGIARGRALKGLLAWVQRLLFNQGDVWRSISPVMIDRLEELRQRNQPLVLIPDWLHPTMSRAIAALPDKVGRAVGNPVRLLYSGNVGGKQGLLDFCKRLHRSDAPFSFRINGDGGGAAQVRDWLGATGDSRFSMGPLVDEPGFVKALHDTDLFVITEKPDKQASFFPSKSIPAMTSGTPILAVSSPDSPLGREARLHEFGPAFSWDRCDEVGPLLSSLASTSERFAQWQKNAVARSHFYDRTRCLDLFESTLHDLVSDRLPVPVLSLARLGRRRGTIPAQGVPHAPLNS